MCSTGTSTQLKTLKSLTHLIVKGTTRRMMGWCWMEKQDSQVFTKMENLGEAKDQGGNFFPVVGTHCAGLVMPNFGQDRFVYEGISLASSNVEKSIMLKQMRTVICAGECL